MHHRVQYMFSLKIIEMLTFPGFEGFELSNPSEDLKGSSEANGSLPKDDLKGSPPTQYIIFISCHSESNNLQHVPF